MNETQIKLGDPGRGGRYIPLTRDYATVVDDEDFERIARHKWRAGKLRRGFYVMRHAELWRDGSGLTRCTIYMHREIVQTQPGEMIDHRDGDSLNNRRSNLRICTHSGNARNQRKQAGRSSQFKGVRKAGQRWRAHIKVNQSPRDARYVCLGDRRSPARMTVQPASTSVSSRPSISPNTLKSAVACQETRHEQERRIANPSKPSHTFTVFNQSHERVQHDRIEEQAQRVR